MAVAGTWLADMAPFIHGDLDAARVTMYADEAAPPPGAGGAQAEAAPTAGGSAAEDVYWEHRADAVRLTREWRRLFRR